MHGFSRKRFTVDPVVQADLAPYAKQADVNAADATKLSAPNAPQPGDLLQFDGQSWVRFPRGTAGQILVSNDSGIAWATPTQNIF